MVEVKVGDTFSSHHDWSDRVISTRTVTKVTEKSIWMQDVSGNTYRVKNTGKDGYYMPYLKGFDLKRYFTLDKKEGN